MLGDRLLGAMTVWIVDARPAQVLIWNREDDSVPWQQELLSRFEPLSTGVPQYWQGGAAGGMRPVCSSTNACTPAKIATRRQVAGGL